MKTDLTELRRVALLAQAAAATEQRAERLAAFHALASPAVVLELLITYVPATVARELLQALCDVYPDTDPEAACAEALLQKAQAARTELPRLRQAVVRLGELLEAAPHGTRTCDQPGCTAAVGPGEKSDTCARGHRLRWVAIDSQHDVLAENARLRARFERLAQAAVVSARVPNSTRRCCLLCKRVVERGPVNHTPDCPLAGVDEDRQD